MFSYHIEQQAVQLLGALHLVMIGDLLLMLQPTVQPIHTVVRGPTVTVVVIATLPRTVM